MDQKNTERFAELVRSHRCLVFFGGAGVSTESGVKDYRSEDGLYNTVKQYGVSPETILSHTFFIQHPDIFYDFYYHYFLDTHAAPNPAHTTLAKWEELGKLQAVVTQNIDGLHQAAGSRRVIELHGTTKRHTCMGCHAEASLETVKAFAGSIARCPRCGGILKPEVVLYEEPLDERVIADAVNAISTADMLIIGGTSLAVYPAASFVRYFEGDTIVLLNKEETPYDRNATLLFREPIGTVLSAVNEILRKDSKIF